MSQIRLNVTTSSRRAGRRRWPLGVPVLFTLNALLVIYYLVVTVVFGIKYFYEWHLLTAGVGYTIMVWSVYLSVPLAAIQAGAGAAIVVGTPRGRLWSMIGVLVAALVAPIRVDVFLIISSVVNGSDPWTGSSAYVDLRCHGRPGAGLGPAASQPNPG